MDIIQEGNLGLMRAVTKFDPTKRYRLISYGVWWIRAYIQNFIMKNWSLVKIGTTQGQRKLFYKIRSAKNLYNEGNISQDEYYAKLSNDLKLSIKEIKEMDIRMGGKDFSLDEEIRAGEQQTRMEFLASGSENQEEIVIQEEQKNELKMGIDAALKVLNEREKYIIDKTILVTSAQMAQGVTKMVSSSKMTQITTVTKMVFVIK